ncbi:MAG: homocysteine biosynthesis protein [Cyanobacteriota bacterium]|nr:homocysteine biosynthesis protein [Cyanobacteriota bacterium]
MSVRGTGAPIAGQRSLEALQQKQRGGDLQVRLASDFRVLVEQGGLEAAYQQTDVVVAADAVLTDQGALQLTLGPCDPPIRLRELQLGGVAAQVAGSGGELLLPLGGALGDPNRRSGAQVLGDLLTGAALSLQGLGDPTALQPRQELSGEACLADFGVARLLLHRAICENGIVAVNTAEGQLRTPYGPLLGPLVSGLYSCGGAGSIGMTMPALHQLGPGSAVLVGGAVGWVLGAGSGHNPAARRQDSGHACVPAACAAVAVDLAQLDPQVVRPCYLEGHGAALLLPVAAPVLLLNQAIAAQAAAGDGALQAPVLDLAVPRRVKPQLGALSYAQLQGGRVTVQGRTLRCAPAHSPRLAEAAAESLREALLQNRFPLQLPAQPLPSTPALRPFDP